MHRLTGETRAYAWGSRTLLPRFLHRPADGAPQAELWLGAHPAAPARTADGASLADLVRSGPDSTLGTGVSSRFGDRLPFLMKALAAAEPLSLQVHPTSSRARAGFDRENAAGLAIEDPRRNYRDDSHKPELVYALTRFEGMAGFRDVERTAEILRLLDDPWSDGVAARLGGRDPAGALHDVVADILALPDPEIVETLTRLAGAARLAETRSHGRRPPATRISRARTSVEREATRVFAQTTALAERYPRDPGVLVTLLLNHVVLSPGEAMFLDAGVVHAYTSGFGIEVMASSDNVIRAGLTPKHVDVPELLDVADFGPMPPPLCEPTALDEHLVRFAPPVEEFALFVGAAPSDALPARGPRILLVLEGAVELATGSTRLALSQGESVFVSDSDGALRLTGGGRVAVATVAQ